MYAASAFFFAIGTASWYVHLVLNEAAALGQLAANWFRSLSKVNNFPMHSESWPSVRSIT